jgi:hypothetical protein
MWSCEQKEMFRIKRRRCRDVLRGSCRENEGMLEEIRRNCREKEGY